jgi:hypothetical protein
VATELLEADGATSMNGWAGSLRHQRIPFVSYPYEWTFTMLKEAALLQLDLVLAGLEEGLILKDGSPYNIQFRGSQPVFIDVGSFERLNPGEPWAGYRQFCMLFLYPLLLQAYRGVPFQPLLRGSLEGIEPSVCRRLFTTRDLFRRGVFSHVVLHERLERRHGKQGGRVRQELKDAGFAAELVKANVARLRKLVARLESPRRQSAWSDYRSSNTYTDEESRRKAEIVGAVAAALKPGLVWDLGCNDGHYARIAAEHAGYTVALDLDETTIDDLYRSLLADNQTSILPLVGDIADPSPGLGWRGLERKPLTERGRPDLVLCLALVHHLAITRNVPLGSLFDWLRGLDSSLLIEFPAPEDPMARSLLDAKRADMHIDYGRETFERRLTEHFVVESSVELSATRTLYHAHPAR